MELSSSGHDTIGSLRCCVLSAFLIAAAIFCSHTAPGEEMASESTDTTEAAPSDADSMQTVDKAFELLAAGEHHTAQELIDELKESWRAEYGPDAPEVRQLDVWLSDFKPLKSRSPSQITEYVAARKKANEVTALIHRMNARQLPHGATLAEAETKLNDCLEVFDRCLGPENHRDLIYQEWLGRIHACRRNWEAAEESFELYLKLCIANFPDCRTRITAARQWLAWALVMRGKDFSRQKEYLEATIAFAEDDQAGTSDGYWPERAMTLLAEVTYRNGDTDEANRLFDEVRRRIPDVPEDECMGASYAHWCLAWCDRNDARRLIAQQKYQEALKVTCLSENHLKTGRWRELNWGVTMQDLSCLRAKALGALGQDYHEASKMHMVLANAIAKHAADLRGESHEPLATPESSGVEDDLSKPCETTCAVVCEPDYEALTGLVVSSTLEEDESGSDFIAELGDSLSQDEFLGGDGLSQFAMFVRLRLALGEFDSASNAALRLHGLLKATWGDEDPDAIAVFRMFDMSQALRILSPEDQQTFCQTMSLLRAGDKKLCQARTSAFPSFKHLSIAVDRLETARERFDTLPEPACEFRANCDYHLAMAHSLQRNWGEAEALLERILEQTDELDYLVIRPPVVRPFLAHVLAHKGGDLSRAHEVIDAGLNLLAKCSHTERHRDGVESLRLLLAELHAFHGDWHRAVPIYNELQDTLDQNTSTYDFCLVHCDRHRVRQLLGEDDLQGAYELIEDVYPRMLLHGKEAFNYPLEVEQTLRLRAEIYERLGRTKDAEADIAYADDIAAHAARLRKMCSADPAQRSKWRRTKLDIPSIETCEEQSGKQQNNPSCQWPFDSNAAATGAYFTPQTSPSPRGQQRQMNY